MAAVAARFAMDCARSNGKCLNFFNNNKNKYKIKINQLINNNNNKNVSRIGIFSNS